MPSKDFWKSKTLWFNLLALVIIVSRGFGFAEDATDPRLMELGGALVAIMQFIGPIVNMVLRLVTKGPIHAFRR